MDNIQDDALMPHSTKSLLEENRQRMINYRKRKRAEMNEEKKAELKTHERERKRDQRAKLKGEQLPKTDPLELLPRPSKMKANLMKKQRAKGKANDFGAFSKIKRQRLKELRKKKKETLTEDEKLELRQLNKERKNHQRKKLMEDEDLSNFPMWIENEIDELEKELNVRPRKIKLWQMTEEQLEEKRKYEREKQRRQRAKIKAQRSIYDPLDLLQINSSNGDYDDDEGSVQHLWRPDVE